MHLHITRDQVAFATFGTGCCLHLVEGGHIRCALDKEQALPVGNIRTPSPAQHLGVQTGETGSVTQDATGAIIR